MMQGLVMILMIILYAKSKWMITYSTTASGRKRGILIAEKHMSNSVFVGALKRAMHCRKKKVLFSRAIFRFSIFNEFARNFALIKHIIIYTWVTIYTSLIKIM